MARPIELVCEKDAEGLMSLAEYLGCVYSQEVECFNAWDVVGRDMEDATDGAIARPELAYMQTTGWQGLLPPGCRIRRGMAPSAGKFPRCLMDQATRHRVLAGRGLPRGPSKKRQDGSQAMTVGRNNPCPCGSGKRYRKCCQGKPGATGTAVQRRVPRSVEVEFEEFLDQHQGLEVYDDVLLDQFSRARDSAFRRNDPAFRARIGTWLERMERDHAEAYRDCWPWYFECKIANAVLDQSAEALWAYKDDLVQLAASNIDVFVEVLDLLAWHGHTALVSDVTRATVSLGAADDHGDIVADAAPSHEETEDDCDVTAEAAPNVDALHEHGPAGAGDPLSSTVDDPDGTLEGIGFNDDSVRFAMLRLLEEVPDLDPLDPSLPERLAPTIALHLEEARVYLGLLGGQLVRKWRIEDLDPQLDAVEEEVAEYNLFELSLAFLGILHRIHGVPYTRGELGRTSLVDYLVWRHSASMNALGLPDRAPKHHLCPDPRTLAYFLSRYLGDFMSSRYCRWAALFGVIPAWLRFLQEKRLLAEEEARSTLEDLRPLTGEMVARLEASAVDPTIVVAVRRWPEYETSASKALEGAHP